MQSVCIHTHTHTHTHTHVSICICLHMYLPHGVVQTFFISCRVQNNWQKPTLPLALLLSTYTRTEWWSLAIIPSGFPPLTRDVSHNLFSELKVLGCTFELKAALKELLVPLSVLIFRNHGCHRGVCFLYVLLTLL